MGLGTESPRAAPTLTTHFSPVPPRRRARSASVVVRSVRTVGYKVPGRRGEADVDERLIDERLMKVRRGLEDAA